MSFIGKAVKKVFSIGKKIVKGIGKAFENKWVRSAFLVALTVFTAGLGSVGFAGFSASMASAGGGLGGFFSAVGSTMAAGYSTIATGVKSFFTGSAAPAAAPITSTGPLGTITAGNLSKGLVTPMSNAPSSGGGGLFGSVKNIGGKILGSLFGTSPGSSILRGAVIGGFNYWGKKEEMRMQKHYRDNATVYGGPAFGGKAEVSPGLIRSPFVPGRAEDDISVAQQYAQNPDAMAQEQAQAAGAPLLPTTQSGATNLAALPSLQQLLVT